MAGRKTGPGKMPVVIAIVVIFALLAAAVAYFRPAGLSAVLFSARRAGNTLSHYILKTGPQFYYLVIEKTATPFFPMANRSR